MKIYTILSVIFMFLTYGAFQEMVRIFISKDADIADNRLTLIPVSIIMTGLFVFLVIKFWKKGSSK